MVPEGEDGGRRDIRGENILWKEIVCLSPNCGEPYGRHTPWERVAWVTPGGSGRGSDPSELPWVSLVSWRECLERGSGRVYGGVAMGKEGLRYGGLQAQTEDLFWRLSRTGGQSGWSIILPVWVFARRLTKGIKSNVANRQTQNTKQELSWEKGEGGRK